MHTCACVNCDYTLKTPENLKQANMVSLDFNKEEIDRRFAEGQRIFLNGVETRDVFLFIFGEDGVLWRFSTAQAEGITGPGRHMCQTCRGDACREKLYGKVEFRQP